MKITGRNGSLYAQWTKDRIDWLRMDGMEWTETDANGMTRILCTEGDRIQVDVFYDVSDVQFPLRVGPFHGLRLRDAGLGERRGPTADPRLRADLELYDATEFRTRPTSPLSSLSCVATIAPMCVLQLLHALGIACCVHYYQRVPIAIADISYDPPPCDVQSGGHGRICDHTIQAQSSNHKNTHVHPCTFVRFWHKKKPNPAGFRCIFSAPLCCSISGGGRPSSCRLSYPSRTQQITVAVP